MSAPQEVSQPTPVEGVELPGDTAPAEQPPVDPAAPQEPSPEDELPEWVRKKIDKANREAKNLRDRMKEQEPKVAAAEEAERAKMTEIDRYKADLESTQGLLAQRDTELLQAKFGIPDDYVEFIGGGTFEEKEARAAKVGLMVQSTKQEEPGKPPSQRPVESLRPGASPTPPPAVDHSYPAAWRPASRES